MIELGFVSGLVEGGTTLVSGGGEVPDLSDLSESELDQPPTYVPNRNMMLLSVAVAYAEARGIPDVFYGAQAHDEYGYWDCTRGFIERLNQVLELNRRDRVTVHAPFVDKKKFELVPLGIKLGVDFSRTWSCYRGGETACGTCPTCVERLKAFREAGAPDPLSCVPRAYARYLGCAAWRREGRNGGGRPGRAGRAPAGPGGARWHGSSTRPGSLPGIGRPIDPGLIGIAG